MLLPYLPVLNSKRIILGSQSKSRNELLSTQQLKYDRISSNFAEDLDKESFATPEEYNLVRILPYAGHLPGKSERPARHFLRNEKGVGSPDLRRYHHLRRGKDHLEASKMFVIVGR